MMCAPVVLFVYNRIEQTQKVIKALNDNRRSRETDLYIYSDAAKDEIEIENVKKVREYLKVFHKEHNFRHVEIIQATVNKGLEKSIIEGVSDIINKYGKIIVLEDDIETSSDFLDYMNQALIEYENDNKIWSVSGYTIDSKRIKKSGKDVFVGYRASCWGWASWADRWNKIDWEMKDYPNFIKSKKAQRDFNKGGADMTFLLKKQQNGEIKSWAIRWCYQQYKEGMLTVFPRNSKVRNIGLDGSGTNCGNVSIKQQEVIVENKWNFSYDDKDLRLYREFQKHYFIAYMRQIFGYYWYKLLEDENCIVYKSNNQCDYSVLKSNFKEWYADPIPFKWKEQNYVFVEIYDKFLQKGCVGLCTLNDEGVLDKPKKIIEEDFHMSFPNVFEYNDECYMIPECSSVEQLRIYKMGTNIQDWKLYYLFENVGKIVDTVVFVNDEQKIYILGSECNVQNPHQSKLMLFEIRNLADKSHIKLYKLWEEKDYSYKTRNGGNFTLIEGEIYRVVQHSTKDVCGKYVTLNKILNLDDNGIEEICSKKIDVFNQNISFPAFIYRIWGIHTYGRIGNEEILDVRLQKFSLGGLILKLYRWSKELTVNMN